VIACVIVAVVSFFTKIMLEFEKQNLCEAFYAINTLSLIFFTLVLQCAHNKDVKSKARESIASQDICVSHTFNIFSISNDDRSTFASISLALVLGIGL